MISASTRNTVILGLVQIGVIVIGVLTAGVCHKWHTSFNAALPQLTTLLTDFGFLALVIPVVWLAVALWIRNLDTDAEAANMIAFCSGILVLVLLLCVVWVGAVRPLLRIMGI